MRRTFGFTPRFTPALRRSHGGQWACRMHVLDMLLMVIMHSGDVWRNIIVIVRNYFLITGKMNVDDIELLLFDTKDSL